MAAIVGDRLVERPDRARQQIRDVDRIHDQRVMLGAEVPRYARGVLRLVVSTRDLEADRERPHGAIHETCHERDHQARIDAPGEEGTERDVAHQATANGVTEELLQRVQICRLGPAGSRAHGDLPVGALGDAVGRDLEQLPRPQAHDVTEDGLPSRVVLERQVVVERLGAEGAAHRPIAQEGLDLRGERQPAVADRVVERLLPQAVAVEEKAAAPIVPQSNGEHAVQALDEGGPLLLVEVDEDFGVGAGAEMVPLRLELGTEVGIVVDLAVEDRPHRAVLVRDRLPAIGEADDAQAAVAHAERAAEVEPVLVGAAVRDGPVHGPQQPGVDRPLGVEVEEAADPAHRSALVEQDDGSGASGVPARPREHPPDPRLPPCTPARSGSAETASGRRHEYRIGKVTPSVVVASRRYVMSLLGESPPFAA